jgi:hypothetical protein
MKNGQQQHTHTHTHTHCEYILEKILSASEVGPILALIAPSPLFQD